MTGLTTKRIIDYLDLLFPDPKCPLIYSNDYTLLIAIMLSAQTTDERVNKVTPILFSKYNSLEAISRAKYSDIEEIIRPLGNQRKKARYVVDIATILCDKYGGNVPRDREILESLPGIGRKTVNVFLSEYYNEAHIAVDTHVNRVSYRLGFSKMSDSVEEVERKLCKKIPQELWRKIHIQMVLFGRYKCKAINPLCSDCKLKDICKKDATK